MNVVEKYNVSIDCVSNILKQKIEYLDDYESNQNKKIKRKATNNLSQQINDRVYEWFILQ